MCSPHDGWGNTIARLIGTEYIFTNDDHFRENAYFRN